MCLFALKRKHASVVLYSYQKCMLLFPNNSPLLRHYTVTLCPFMALKPLLRFIPSMSVYSVVKTYLFFFSETLKRQNAVHEPGLSFVIKDITNTTGKIN